MQMNFAAVIAAVTAVAALAGQASAQGEATITNLHPAGATSSHAQALRGNQQVGYARVADAFNFHAVLWSGTAASWVDLHPAGATQSVAYATTGTMQGGYVFTDGVVRATLWNGTAASRVDLHPAGATASSVSGVGGVEQVGSVVSNGRARAALWRGTAASLVDLHPAGALDSGAVGTDGAQQCGEAVIASTYHAGYWNGTAASWVDLHPAAASESMARGISGGEQVGQARVNGALHASVWFGTAASWVDLHPANATQSIAFATDGTHQVGFAIVGPVRRACLWSGTAGSLIDLHALLPLGYESSEASGLSNDGANLTIVGSGFNTATSRDEALIWTVPIDTDRDGLPNDWEVNGVPYTKSDGSQARYVLAGANPLKKDLYVEVDAMATRAPELATLQRVADAFDPADRVLVPAVPGVPGALANITLHIDTDAADLALALTNAGDYVNGDVGFDDFETDKRRFFGTPVERADPEWGTPAIPGPMQLAKLKAYRYCIFANSYGGTTSSGVAKGIPSNDFMVTLGAFTPAGGTQDQQAGTFMHEMGHTLGLQHGGGAGNQRYETVQGVEVDLADINWRPNYYSVMNYWWQIPNLWHAGAWGLRYSEGVLPTLNELELSEASGLGASLPGVRVPFRVPSIHPCFATCYASSPGLCYQYAPLDAGAAVDWNADCTTTPVAVAADINDFSPLEGPGASAADRVYNGHGLTLLEGHNDWLNLVYNFRASSTYAPGSAPEPNTCDFNTAISAFLDTIPARCAVDLGGQGGLPEPDGALDNNDFIAFIDYFFAADPAADMGAAGGIAGSDSLFDNNDFIVFIDRFFTGC